MMQRIQPRLLAILLATTLVALACEQPPSPTAPRGPNFVVQGGTDRITGGGKLGGGRDFATFGFNARDGQGQIEWVQHCLDGVGSGTFCSFGSFNFHGSTVSEYGVQVPDDPDFCRTWSGTGEAKFKDPTFTDGTFSFTARACDFGQPGRDTDSMCFTFELYQRDEFLAGGNIQLHNGGADEPVLPCLPPEV
jgi:hypothetical protein